MTGSEIRKKFIEYFAQRDHAVVKSALLVPQNDPTLLFTNAGMVQFKDIFLDKEKSQIPRAVSVQKCVRAGGKHNDLEMVGRTTRHHTFFEMLGNFSFGDYFKKEAIHYGWEFLTDVIGIPKDRLYVSIYNDDEEAFGFWRGDVGLEGARIYRMDEKDNFWSMGNTGPCGPCSEIYIDQGEFFGCGKPSCTVGCDCGRYLEIWNLVFMQYNRDESGSMSPLPNPCIDTGMGLERLTAVVQGKTSNYDSDLLMEVIKGVAEVSSKTYGKNQRTDVSIRVISDHARAVTFLISDGVLPSNEGRGYVLRRILRRALRHGKFLGMEKPFLYKISSLVVSQFQEAYPEIEGNRAFIIKVVQNEEESFRTTLKFGTQRLDEIFDQLKNTNQTAIPGGEIFKLYDTYGFPVDLLEEIALDSGYSLDMLGFERAMQEQKERAMASWKGSGEKQVAAFYKTHLQCNEPTQFLGYGRTDAEARIIAILKEQKEVEIAAENDEVEILLDRTPFYGESGGQVGDTGQAVQGDSQLEITHATKPVSELIIHHARVGRGTIKKGDILKLEVDRDKRRSTTLNHTATHLLHAALKAVLGEHVKQAGSLVAPDRLRFDYTHFSPVTDREKTRVEDIVNEKIRENIAVCMEEMKIEQALEKGAIALFGEKYGDTVRVVSVSDFSKEFCGGTHTNATGDIGLFKVVSEGGIASGVRRIEAITGEGALLKVHQESKSLNSIRTLLKVQPDEELIRLQKLIERNRELEKEIENLKGELVSGKTSKDEVLDVNGVSAIVKKMDGMDSKTLRTFIDNAKNRLKSGVVVVGSSINGKVLLAVGVTKNLTQRFHAGNIVKAIAELVGGNGGGRPDMAQAGGTKPEMLDKALKKAHEIISAQK